MKALLGSGRRNRPALFLPIAAVFCVLTTSCSWKGPGNNVAATVDGEKIYNADVERYFQNQTAGSNQPLSEEQATGLRLSILENLIDNQILMHRAGKLGLLATEDEVERRLKEMKTPYSDQDFAKQLQQRNLTLDDVKREIRRSLTAEKVINREVTSKINITQQDITAYYNQHRAEFNLIEPRYHLAHIMVTATPDPQAKNLGRAASEAEAKKKIDTVLAQLQTGAEFSALAMTYSEDTATSANGGDIGIVPESALKQTDQTTRDDVMKLKPGQYTPVLTVVSPSSHQLMGFQIVKLISMEPAGLRDLSDQRVQQDIRQQLQDRREQLLKTAYFEVMRNQAKIENYYAQQVLAGSTTAR
ncbi:MAG TPA: SurA N-terminal domain-containing protein [Terriglobales bacterium]|nr:SurA N-terminal domain-containing protein [Terriglobales bacterium]